MPLFQYRFAVLSLALVACGGASASEQQDEATLADPSTTTETQGTLPIFGGGSGSLVSALFPRGNAFGGNRRVELKIKNGAGWFDRVVNTGNWSVAEDGHYLIGTIASPVAEMNARRLSNGSISFSLTGWHLPAIAGWCSQPAPGGEEVDGHNDGIQITCQNQLPQPEDDPRPERVVIYPKREDRLRLRYMKFDYTNKTWHEHSEYELDTAE